MFVFKGYLFIICKSQSIYTDRKQEALQSQTNITTSYPENVFERWTNKHIISEGAGDIAGKNYATILK